MQAHDKWTKWLTKSRYGQDPGVTHATNSYLEKVRDRVLRRAQPRPHDILVDIGSGDGLIGLGAEKYIGPSGHIYFTDISESAVELCKTNAALHNLQCATSFVTQAAEQLDAFADASVDVVVCRAVFMYSTEKQKCFDEVFRVLKPGGRFSIYEPINRWTAQLSTGTKTLFGIDLSPLGETADVILRALRLPPDLEGDVMLNYDERDLFALAQSAGFVDLDLELHLTQSGNIAYPRLEILLNSAPNPLIPTLGSVLEDLPSEERDKVIGVLENGMKRPLAAQRRAEAYLAGKKSPT